MWPQQSSTAKMQFVFEECALCICLQSSGSLSWLERSLSLVRLKHPSTILYLFEISSGPIKKMSNMTFGSCIFIQRRLYVTRVIYTSGFHALGTPRSVGQVLHFMCRFLLKMLSWRLQSSFRQRHLLIGFRRQRLQQGPLAGFSWVPGSVSSPQNRNSRISICFTLFQDLCELVRPQLDCSCLRRGSRVASTIWCPVGLSKTLLSLLTIASVALIPC